MDSYISEMYSSINQTSTLTQIVLVVDNQHFTQPYHNNLDKELEPFRQYLRSAHSISCGPCITPQLLETNSNHPDDSSLSSVSDAEPGASASEFGSCLQGNQDTQNSTASSDAHVYALQNSATTTLQAPGPSREVIPRPRRKCTNLYRHDGTSAMLQSPNSTRLSKSGKRGKKTEKLQLKCKLCPNFFAASTGDLKRHLESLAHKKPSYICERCDGKFTREDALKRHKLHACPASRKNMAKWHLS